MGWVFLQVFLAFGTGILIVWWTWPKASKPPKPPVSHEVPGTQQQVTTKVFSNPGMSLSEGGIPGSSGR